MSPSTLVILNLVLGVFKVEVRTYLCKGGKKRVAARLVLRDGRCRKNLVGWFD